MRIASERLCVGGGIAANLRRNVAIRCMAPVLVVGLLLGLAARAQAGNWTPRAWAGENTVELGVVRDGRLHWFKVWVVVIDDQPYVRLGKASAAKIDANKTKPHLGVRVAGQEFDRVQGQAAPEMAERVAEAMAEKYWSDFAVRLVPHPLTLRLLPPPDPAK